MMDLHIHTPASEDYQQPEVTFLDLLQRAEARGLDIVAFTDHNTIAGFRKFREEIDQLELLEKLNRLMPDEKNRLAEYRRIQSKILVLPAFEFTATFGFHIIGLFSPDKPIREIEHLLLNLNIPSDQIDDGSVTVGASADVLTAYRLINQAGGIVIAAHANSSNGVAMRGFSFGGQTKIAYTQDTNLNALEVTDLEAVGSRTTAGFFNGTKPEYPRRMHCIQGSDCHRLFTDSQRKKNLGLGDRATEVLLPELSFQALKDLFNSNDFSRTRPYRQEEEPAYDFIQAALDEGPNIIQDFHESLTMRAGKLYAIIADVCAFANTNGGTLYIGLNSDPKKAPLGVENTDQAVSQLEKEISNRISPPLHLSLDTNEYKKRHIIRVLIPRGDDPPYALDDNKIYVRDEAETGLAVRDEIVGLVLRGHKQRLEQVIEVGEKAEPAALPTAGTVEEKDGNLSPRTGVEVLSAEDRDGVMYFTVRDLRNGNVVKNVTRTSARRLWHYAINRYAEMTSAPDKNPIDWQEDFGIARNQQQGKTIHYDLVFRAPEGLHYYFGVTPNGIHGPWKDLIGEEDIA
jgi:hypothetical protein